MHNLVGPWAQPALFTFRGMKWSADMRLFISELRKPASNRVHPGHKPLPQQSFAAILTHFRPNSSVTQQLHQTPAQSLCNPLVKAHDQLIIMGTITNQNHPDNQHRVGQTHWLGQPTSAHNPPPPPPITNRPECKATGPWNTDAQPRWQTGQNAKHHTLHISTENLPGSFLQNLTKLVISGTMADMNCRHMESASSFSLLRSGCTQTEQSTTDPLVHVPQYHNTMTQTEQLTTDQLVFVPQYHNTMTQTEQLTTDPLVFVPQYYDTDRTANSKRWFTTSFLQPLPYLVTPLGPENCQLTSRFLLVLKQ